jgi:branched-chain amino acid transport system substrate-binding protein
MRDSAARRRASTWTVTAAGAALVLAISACGSSSNNDNGGAKNTGSVAAPSPTAPASEATGAPITIGMINEENTPAGSFPEIREAEKAAVDYVNKELGGVNGHPYKLVTCITDVTPASSASCANKMIDEKVLVVTSGIDFGTSGSLPILEKAGIPYIGGDPLLVPELTSKNALFFAGGTPGAFLSQDAYIGKELKAKKVSIIYTDNPAGLAAATTFSQKPLEKAGVPASGIKLVAAPADATDFTPAVAQANASSPDIMMVLFAAQGCSRIMQAKQSLGVTAKMIYPGSCIGQPVIKAGGAGANGAYFNSEWKLYNDLSDPEVALYQQKLKKYQPSSEASGYSQLGFQTIMNLTTVLKTMGDPATLKPQDVFAKLKTQVNQPNFMADNYSCDGSPIPAFASVCNMNDRIVQYNNGKFTDVLGKWISGADLFG